jgi:lipoate-protein ligase A
VPVLAIADPPRRAPAADALAAGEALLARAVEGELGVEAHVIDPPALVVGSGQRLETVDEEACRRAGLEVVRRGSGGGAVRCDGRVLGVDVALPAGHPLALDDVVEAYAWVGRAWVDALAAVGVEALLVAPEAARAQGPGRREAARAACWAGISPYEVLTADGRKLVGLAQRRRRGAVLHQAAVACAGRPGDVLELLRLAPDVRAEAAAALARTAALVDVAPGLATPEAAWSALGPGLAAPLDAQR